MTAGAEQASQAMLLDLARCSNMYGALFPSGTAGAPEALPPPPPPAAAGAAAGTTLPLDPTTQLLLSGDTAAANLWAAQVGLRGAKRGVEEVLGAPPVSGPTERAKRKKLMRQGQKDLLIQLDSLLHVGDQRSAHKNILEAALDAASAGRPKSKASRVLGRDGRTLHNIIEDAIIRIRALKNMRVQGDTGPRPLSDTTHAEQPHRQGMLSSKGLWTLELELPDLKVIAMSDGLKEWCTKQQAGAEEGAAASVPVGHLCDIAHPDDEFALRKAVADQKMAGTRLSLRLEQRTAPQDAESAAGSKETKETPGKKLQAGKHSGKGKQEKKDETSYLKVDMLLAGITVGTRRLVLVSPRVSEPMQTVQEVLPPASLQHQQQRWHKREQRLQHRVQAHELDKKQQQHELAKDLASAAAAAAGCAKQPASDSHYSVEVKAEDWSSGDATLAANAQAAAAAAAAAAVSKLLQGQHSFATAALAAPAVDATDASATPEARAAAAAFGPGLAGLAALLNAGAQAGGAGGDQKAGLDAAGLGPLLQMAAMQMSLAQQQVSASGEGSAALAANANAALLSALASTQLATDGTVPGAALPALSSEGILHYLTALAALSAPGGAEGNVLYEQLLASAGLVGGVKGMCGKGAGVGGIKGAKGKPVPKGKGKAEKGKKSSPFEAEEVEVAATLALLRNPNPAAAVVARAQGGLDASGSAESYSSMVSAAAAAALAAAAAAVAAKGKGGTGVGLKKEAKRGSGSAGDMMRRASDCSDDGDDAAPSGAMDDREARRMRRKKMRKLQKTLAVELDLLLPRLGANSKSYKWAGRRSVGRTGRSLVEILVDTAKSVRAIRDKKAQGAATGADVGGLKEAGEGQSAGGAAKCGGHYAYFKEGMLVSQSVALIDVALADFSILASSQAFRMYSKAGSMAGTARLKLEQLVHPSDMPSLQALIYRADVTKMHPLRVAAAETGDDKKKDAASSEGAEGGAAAGGAQDENYMLCHAQLVWLCPTLSRVILILNGLDGKPLLESPSGSIAALAAAGDKPDEVPPPPPLPAAAAAGQKEGSEDADASGPADATKA